MFSGYQGKVTEIIIDSQLATKVVNRPKAVTDGKSLCVFRLLVLFYLS